MTRTVSVFLLLVGVLWGTLVVLYLGLVLGGVTSVGHLLTMLVKLFWLYTGPLFLIAGALLSFTSHREKLGTTLALVGSLMLLGMAVVQWFAMLHDVSNPASIKPPAWEISLIGLIVLLTNGAAFKNYLSAHKSKR